MDLLAVDAYVKAIFTHPPARYLQALTAYSFTSCKVYQFPKLNFVQQNQWRWSSGQDAASKCLGKTSSACYYHTTLHERDGLYCRVTTPVT